MIDNSPGARCCRVGICVLTLWMGSPSMAEETLGRLFFTPERRHQLDRQRQLNAPDRQQTVREPLLTIDGVVVRSSGRRTAWVNGSPQHEDEVATGLSITPRRGDPGKVWVEANDAPTARARVGETVNSGSGETSDLLHGGQVVVKSTSRSLR